MEEHERAAVTSTAAPTVRWWCPQCKTVEVFACREKFRTNANGKTLDIWLLYGCRTCDRTKNMAILERTAIGRVPSALLAAAERNDSPVARRYARDLAVLRHNSARLAEPDAWRVHRPSSIPRRGPAADVTLDVVFPEPLIVPILGVTADLLAVSRSRLRRLLREGSVIVEGGRLDGLRLWREARVTLTGRPSS